MSTIEGLSDSAPGPTALEEAIRRHPQRFRVLTGDRPTGPLHLGHYLGTLANRVRLQRAGVEVFLVIADYQVITDRDAVGELTQTVGGLVLDYLAAGIDPAAATIFTHSSVPALNQLLLPFLSLVTVAELERNPTVKAEAAASPGRGLSALLLTYPVHQAADILFCHGNLVPVGKDQLPPRRDDSADRSALQRALRRGRDDLPSARRAAHRRARPPRHRRDQDEQEPRQHHRARRR
jgi:tryptophanyl-tRNA synthetase